jgi:hypothetical protein
MQHYTFDNGSTVAVWHDGRYPDFAALRQRYGYAITTPAWEYVADDIHSGCGDPIDEDDAAATLFAFLSAAATELWYEMGGQHIFPEEVAEWAQEHEDEISLLSARLEPEL